MKKKENDWLYKLSGKYWEASGHDPEQDLFSWLSSLDISYSDKEIQKIVENWDEYKDSV